MHAYQSIAATLRSAWRTLDADADWRLGYAVPGDVAADADYKAAERAKREGRVAAGTAHQWVAEDLAALPPPATTLDGCHVLVELTHPSGIDVLRALAPVECSEATALAALTDILSVGQTRVEATNGH